ncbi:MAG: PspA/IM30 family protein [Verrucomicrobia bacterium ADurb.Bin474]|nr:MAG: PspA/IM30 family protein [Verrucomicrobia bacterium ADurb.Bin474]
MKDTISSRIRRIITGTANSIVSKIEGLAPETILEQAIDEVDSAISEVKVELGRVTAQKHHVTKTISRLNEEHSRLNEQIPEAGQQNRKDLVEAAISRQIDIEDQLPALENQLIDMGQQEKELNAAIAGLLAKRNEMEDELFDFRQSKQIISPARDAGSIGSSPVPASPEAKVERAEQAFDRVIRNTAGLRRTIQRSSSQESAKLVELANLNKQARVAARMKQLESES